MGDRVLMQCFSSKTGEFGPVVYGHWCGGKAPAIVAALAKRMESRGGDVAYSSARLVQEAIGENKDALSFGIWNAAGRLTADDSHGDAGCVLIDVDSGHAPTYLGGYLASAQAGGE